MGGLRGEVAQDRYRYNPCLSDRKNRVFSSLSERPAGRKEVRTPVMFVEELGHWDIQNKSTSEMNPVVSVNGQRSCGKRDRTGHRPGQGRRMLLRPFTVSAPV